MDLYQLEMLLAVVEGGGYSKAGKQAHISHSAIHRQIRLLEHELGDRILVRAGRNLELTEAGRILVNFARKIRQDVSGVKRQIRELTELESGHLKIGTGTTMLVFFLPPILERFRRTFPKIEVHMMTGTTNHFIEELSNGNLDLAIVFSPDIAKWKGMLKYELLYKEEFVLAVGKGHPMAKKRMVSLDQLLKSPFIMYSKTSHVRQVLEAHFKNAGLTPKVIMELENEEAIEKMIELNLGVAVLSRRRAVSDKIHYFLLPDHRIFCDVWMLFPKLDYAPRAVREFAHICREASVHPDSKTR